MLHHIFFSQQPAFMCILGVLFTAWPHSTGSTRWANLKVHWPVYNLVWSSGKVCGSCWSLFSYVHKLYLVLKSFQFRSQNSPLLYSVKQSLLLYTSYMHHNKQNLDKLPLQSHHGHFSQSRNLVLMCIEKHCASQKASQRLYTLRLLIYECCF